MPSSTERPSDSKLLSAIADGDCHALEALYRGYRRRLGRFLSRFTQCQQNVEEIINDTFFVVWRSANSFRSASQVSSWIFGIAYRTALKSLRSQNKHLAARSFGERQVRTLDPTLEVEVKDWVVHGLSRLPEEQRVAVELFCHVGYSLAEIAEITGAPIGTVKARTFHARQKLRYWLPTLGGNLSELPASSVQALGHASQKSVDSERGNRIAKATER
jgi:RNA polymerase sigma-70 factor (ECF subfamily)